MPHPMGVSLLILLGLHESQTKRQNKPYSPNREGQLLLRFMAPHPTHIPQLAALNKAPCLGRN